MQRLSIARAPSSDLIFQAKFDVCLEFLWRRPIIQWCRCIWPIEHHKGWRHKHAHTRTRCQSNIVVTSQLQLCNAVSYGFCIQSHSKTAFLQEFGVKIGRGCAPNPLSFLQLKKRKSIGNYSSRMQISKGVHLFKIFSRARAKCWVACQPDRKT